MKKIKQKLCQSVIYFSIGIFFAIYSKTKYFNMANGKINVAVENIFPLIKKFLYSDHEIFKRVNI